MDEVVTVSDEEIIAALVTILERCKLVVEPAGAAAVAGILSGRIAGLEGRTVVAVLSGSNLDREKLAGFLT